MSLPRILFVDDEANILDGLRNLLRKHRRVWDIVFALGGQAALAEMERAPVDVIVTDMRMPGMDGAALLKKVKEDYPTVARIVTATGRPAARYISPSNSSRTGQKSPSKASRLESICMSPNANDATQLSNGELTTDLHVRPELLEGSGRIRQGQPGLSHSPP